MPVVEVKNKPVNASSSEYHRLFLSANRFISESEVQRLPGYYLRISVPMEEVEIPQIEERLKEEKSIFFLCQQDIELLRKYYVIEDNDEFGNFFISHNQLMNILLEAPKWIEKIFGEPIKIHLRVYFDPEEDYEELFIIIKTSLKPKEGLNRLNVLDEEWFIKVVDKAGGYLNVTEEAI